MLALDDRDGSSQTVVRVNRDLEAPEALYQHRSTDAMGYHADIDRSVYAVDFALGNLSFSSLSRIIQMPKRSKAKSISSVRRKHR